MSKRMLIDAAHPEETRVVVADGSRIEELDFESASRKQLRGNIYLAKVTRVEPSLQAAFIEYGGNRHGFLAFNEIHPDYYQIPVADREALMREVDADHDDDDDDAEAGEADDEAEEAFLRRQRRLMRRYKIQEVLRRRQIMLVQVVKEERGNKGAALTTYLSLAGRYGVLMPNTARGGGISRKIVSATDRRRLKTVVQGLDVPTGMGLIVRTAGAKRTKAEINRDYDYLLRLWENIRETTLKSVAPSLIYEEEDLVKRAIRDMFDKDLTDIMVEGEAGYREAKRFMRMIMPSQASKITPYRERTPLFTAYKIEDQIAQIHSPVVPLKSGGYLVINQTEALVAVDVNSGKATRERNVEATAFKTNLEAAEETARQLRLRDLAGLIVIDFIDMDESKNNRAVEKVLKDCLAHDRARVQMGKISPFGLMEISRQRRRSGVLEGSTHVCEHCQGTGRVRSIESSALAALRAVELEAARNGAGAVTVRLPTAVALYLLNEKRSYMARLEQLHLLEVVVLTEEAFGRSDIEIERTAAYDPTDTAVAARFAARHLPVLAPLEPEDDEDDLVEEIEFEDEDEEPVVAEAEDSEDEPRAEAAQERSGRGRRRRRGGRRDEPGQDAPDAEAAEGEGDAAVLGEDDEAGPRTESDAEGDEHQPRRRRRGRRGGRRTREENTAADPYAWVHPHGGDDRAPASEDPYVWRDPHAPDARPEDRSYATEAEAVETRSEALTQGAPASETADDTAATQTYARADGGAPAEGASEPKSGRRRSRGGRRRGRDRHRDEDGAALSTEEQRPGGDDAPGSFEAESAEGLRQPEQEPEAFQAAATDEDAAPISVSETEPPESDAALEPAPAFEAQAGPMAPAEAELPEPPIPEPAAPREPDPAEISGQPATPRRGWWRRNG